MPGQESGAPQRTGRVGGLGIIANVRAVVVIKQKVRRETPQSSGRVRTRPHRHVRRRTSDVARRAGEHAGESAVACGGVMGGRARAVGQYAVNIVARAAAGAGVWVSRGGDWGGPRVGPCACRANGACASSPRSRCPPASCVPRTTVRHISHVHVHAHVHLYGHGHGPPPPTTIHVHSTYSACLYIATSSAINQALSKNHINLTNRPPR